MALIRLNKFLSDQGICSRRAADEHILAGKVSVNGEKAHIGQKIDPEIQKVTFDSVEINPEKEKLVYYAVNKPKGVVSTANDEMNRKSVVDLVPQSPRVYPIGRLDKDSEGLMILTNDGELTNLLTHPKNKHEKEYEVVVSSIKYQVLSTKEVEKQLLEGLMIEGKLMKADSIEIHKDQRSKFYILNVVLHTGYNRQIRKMCAKLGLEVLKLARTRISSLSLNNLNIKPGEYKIINKSDILYL
ncbi:MAG: rRNA pseudouridine synthase [Patescibacteria group bacterium]|nr:rRNA pseudouridine synthase [Patescibacteria group bacterium]